MHGICDGSHIFKSKSSSGGSERIIMIIASGRRIKPMIHIRYGPANNCLPDLRIDLHCLLIFGFRFVHDLDVEWNDIDSDMLPHIVEQGGVDKPFKAVCHNLDFIVDTLEDHRGDITFHKSFFRFYDLNILRADHNVHRSVISKPSSTQGIFTPRISTTLSWIIVPSMILLSPIKSATKAFVGSL